MQYILVAGVVLINLIVLKRIITKRAYRGGKYN